MVTIRKWSQLIILTPFFIHVRFFGETKILYFHLFDFVQKNQTVFTSRFFSFLTS
jgi:hypothetical protein